jgi:hypothetical protein
MSRGASSYPLSERGARSTCHIERLDNLTPATGDRHEASSMASVYR